MKLNNGQKLGAAALLTSTFGLSVGVGFVTYQEWRDPANVAARAEQRAEREAERIRRQSRELRERQRIEREQRFAQQEAEREARDRAIEERRGAWRNGEPQPEQPSGWDDAETFDFCYAEAPRHLGRVKWGFLGTPEHSIWPALKTVILKGEFQTAYGGWRPFAIECRETANGPRVVEVNRL